MKHSVYGATSGTSYMSEAVINLPCLAHPYSRRNKPAAGKLKVCEAGVLLSQHTVCMMQERSNPDFALCQYLRTAHFQLFHSSQHASTAGFQLSVYMCVAEFSSVPCVP